MSLRSLLGAALLALTGLAQAAPLQLQVYNPGEAAVFPVSSTLISGERAYGPFIMLMPMVSVEYPFK